MKQIIPFKKELLLKTKVSEITSISLEHTLSLKEDDLVSGEFHITGDYKMTEGSIQREKFSFCLPFEIALDALYDVSTMVIDIDNFYYEIINNEALQVNIDVYVEGKKLPEKKVVEMEKEEEEKALKEKVQVEFPDLSQFIEEQKKEEDLERKIQEKNTLEMPEVPKIDGFFEKEREGEITRETPPEKSVQYPSIDNIQFEEKEETGAIKGFNLFENIDNSDTYVTYHVYIVKETDTIETIMKKYEVSKDVIALYNNLEDVKPGMKLIIPN